MLGARHECLVGLRLLDSFRPQLNSIQMIKRYSLLVAALLACNVCLAGAWGAGSFDNDDALDWVQSCTESKSATLIGAALHAAVKPGALDASEGAAAVAAAELVASARGKPGKSVPKELSDWLQRQPKQEIARLSSTARKALARVKDPGASELRQLWKESDDKQWVTVIDELDKRLR